MLVGDKVTTSVLSDPDVPEIDQAQYDAGNGPCLQAFRDGKRYDIPSTASDGQWPELSAAALEHGARSTMSLPLIAGGPVGALNSYAADEDAFSDRDHEIGARFATQAAYVLANAQACSDARSMGANLQEAVRSRATSRRRASSCSESDVGPDDAFDILRRASQRENRKLRDVAQEMVDRRRRDRSG